MIAALVDAGLRLELPLDELRGYIRSMQVDCARVRIATRAELDSYMDGSAASVGRVMAAILGARREAEAFARLGVAFQLTNFVRDVRVDYELDRIYLPADELERFGVDAAALGLVSATPQLRALLSVEVGRARALFGETAAAVAAALPAARRGMRFARAAYLSVLDRVEAVDYDVLAHSIRPGAWGLARAALADQGRSRDRPRSDQQVDGGCTRSVLACRHGGRTCSCPWSTADTRRSCATRTAHRRSSPSTSGPSKAKSSPTVGRS